MQSYIVRKYQLEIKENFDVFPVVALLGPRQCGKSTLAKQIIKEEGNFIFLDLEKPSDLKKLDDPELFFANNRAKRICIDEIQLRPDLFPVLRSIIDEHRVNGQLLILGSASRDLIKQSSETLAGRIGYIEISPFIQEELQGSANYEVQKHWLRGGFPNSYLQKADISAFLWTENFIRTFVERDIPQLGLNIPALTARRFITMCAHNQGQINNNTNLANALNVSYHTIQNYIDFLEQTFLLRVLPPLEANLNKRLIKSPKVYIRDSGLLHAFLEISSFNNLLGHPVFEMSWEGFALENILGSLPDWKASFYRTSSGNKIDLILEKGLRRIAVEFKASSAPHISKGFYIALNDLQIEEAYVVSIVNEAYPIKEKVWVCPINYLVNKLKALP